MFHVIMLKLYWNFSLFRLNTRNPTINTRWVDNPAHTSLWIYKKKDCGLFFLNDMKVARVLKLNKVVGSLAPGREIVSLLDKN